jgi:hypothetical protein
MHTHTSAAVRVDMHAHTLGCRLLACACSWLERPTGPSHLDVVISGAPNKITIALAPVHSSSQRHCSSPRMHHSAAVAWKCPCRWYLHDASGLVILSSNANVSCMPDSPILALVPTLQQLAIHLSLTSGLCAWNLPAPHGPHACHSAAVACWAPCCMCGATAHTVALLVCMCCRIHGMHACAAGFTACMHAGETQKEVRADTGSPDGNGSSTK